MKKTKLILVLATFVLGLAASACHPKHTCPAYGKAYTKKAHRV